MKKLFALTLVGLLLLLANAGIQAAIAALGGIFDVQVTADTISVTSDAKNTTGANFLAGCVSDYESNTATVVTDSVGNTVTMGTEYKTATAARSRAFYFKNITTNASHTVTATGSGSTYPAIVWRAFSGVHATAPGDQANGDNLPSGGTTATPNGGITPSVDNTLVWACTAFSAATAVPTITLLSTPDGAGFAGGNNYGVAMAYEIQTTATARNPTWTYSVASSGGNSITSVKAAAGGTITPRGTLLGVLP